MELIAAVLLAGPIGYLSRTRPQARLRYLALWALIFPIQTIVVHSENPDDIEPLYFVFNAIILAGGLGLNTLGARLRVRRAGAAALLPLLAVAIVTAALAGAPPSYARTTDYRGAFKCRSDGQVLKGARIELWQTHKRWLPEVPPNFVHRNTTRADENGAWAFRVSGGESNWRIRLVLVGPYARVQDWPFPWNWYTHTLRSQNNTPLRDYGMQVVDGYQCGLYTGMDAAGKDYQAETGLAPPQGVTVVRAGAPTAGTPFTLYDEVWWPSGKAAIASNGTSVARHEFAHVFRHIFDGSMGHFLTDAAQYAYPQTHSGSKCVRTNSGFAFNEGWAEYWAGSLDPGGVCPGDPNTGTIERNVAWMLQNVQNYCRISRGRMAQVHREHRMHTIDEFTKALNCKPPSFIKALGKPKKQSRQAVLITQRRGMVSEGRKIIRRMGKPVPKLKKELGVAKRLARVHVACPKQPCEARIARAVRPVLLQGQITQARALRERLAFLARPKAIKRLVRLPLGRQARLIELRRKGAIKASSRAAVKTLRRVRSIAKSLGADAGTLRILSQAARLAGKGDPETLQAMSPAAQPAAPKRVGPTPTPAPAPGPAGPGAPPAPQLRFTDWTSVTGSPATATGTLHGVPISLSGSAVDTPPQSVVDGTSTVFNRPDFSPPLTASDAIHFRGAGGNSYTLDFGATVTDPVLHLGSLGSTLHFPAGTVISRLSGDAEFGVSGADVIGAADDTPSGDDANGTVRLSGSFTSIPFTTDFPGTDGIYLQVGRIN
jgi:hypothetical protein